MDKLWTAQERDVFKKLGGRALIDWQKREWGIIFSLSFAKAFWGESTSIILSDSNAVKGVAKNWEFHLQQMVLEKDPIKYLEKYI